VSLQHVTVTVPSEHLIGLAEDFYRTLGGVPLQRPPRLAEDTPGCWVGFGEGTQVHVIVGDAAATQAHFGLDLGDHYDDALAALAGAGAPIRTARDLWGGRRAFVTDPAGNLVEVFDRPPPSEPAP
jgi:catechol 2,3-dioxygenase-like lactoylglutathione lyase family enzyme